MKKNRQKKLYHWFCVLLVGASLFGCGRPEHSASEGLEVNLDLSGSEPELFWYGVQERKLEITREGKNLREFTWNQGQSIPCELEQGDQLTFKGLDSRGQLLILGSTSVGKEKKVSIPLRRILY